MLRKILDTTDPKLRKKSRPVQKVDKKIKFLIKDLKETLAVQEDPEGIGLAAPQIGKNVQVFAIKPKEDIKIIINPKVVSVSKEKTKIDKTKTMEGCLSLPHYYGPLQRAKKIKIKYLNENGDQITETFSDLDAQIVLHEIDHLKGKLFVDRLIEQKKPLYELVDGEWQEVELA
jgi:peptide deformylase